MAKIDLWDALRPIIGRLTEDVNCSTPIYVDCYIIRQMSIGSQNPEINPYPLTMPNRYIALQFRH